MDLIKGFNSKFCVGSQDQPEIPEKDPRMHWPKHCDYDNKDEDNSLNALNNKHFI